MADDQGPGKEFSFKTTTKPGGQPYDFCVVNVLDHNSDALGVRFRDELIALEENWTSARIDKR